ncbi:MAG: 16S rRNA (guanine(966)-N(2))-methyltransferase RsmD [Paracoccaceae bacterium]
MRIIAGRYRGTALSAVGKGDANAHLRPTTDRVRESLFNVLAGGKFDDPITEARVLDLFAGTGALGLEALSRGASHVTFVENGRKALSLIRANITKLAAKDDTEILAADATKPGKLKSDTPFDLVFLDPPYGKALGQKALARLHEDGSLAPGALVVWEENGPQDAPEGYTCLETRKFGGTHITFLRAADLETSQI